MTDYFEIHSYFVDRFDDNLETLHYLSRFFLNDIKRWYLETVAISLKEALILP